MQGPCGKRGCGAEGSGGEEGGPGLGDEDLGALPEEDAGGPMAAEGPLVSERREGVGDGLDEVQRGSLAAPGSLEDAQEARVGSAKALRHCHSATIGHGPDDDVLCRGSCRLPS